MDENLKQLLSTLEGLNARNSGSSGGAGEAFLGGIGIAIVIGLVLFFMSMPMG